MKEALRTGAVAELRTLGWSARDQVQERPRGTWAAGGQTEKGKRTALMSQAMVQSVMVSK